MEQWVRHGPTRRMLVELTVCSSSACSALSLAPHRLTLILERNGRDAARELPMRPAAGYPGRGAGPDRLPALLGADRVRRDPGRASAGAGGDGDDGYIRFDCPCGRRLKVRAESGQESGICPDCGRVVAVPSTDDLTMIPARSSRPHEAPTEELGPDDIALLERWAKGHLSRQGRGEAGGNPGGRGPRRCGSRPACASAPRCGRPVHLGAVTCRECGADVPKR